jgi:signal peptidase I
MNFALILFGLTTFTFICWLCERFWWQPRRFKSMERALAALAIEKDTMFATLYEQKQHTIRMAAQDQPWWVEYTAGLFPVIFTVFFVRSFIVEPFKIPSGSMIPTLMIGDLILVNKFTYGVRLPVLNHKVLDVGQPQRGDVMVFRYPPDPTIDYIKRVVGVPGDVVSYQNKKLMINGQAIATKPLPDFLDPQSAQYSRQWSEQLSPTTSHRILNDDGRPSLMGSPNMFPSRQNCTYNVSGFVCKVPAGHYFMMGDNRDNSSDSRYWGFVPEQNIVGRAFFVWMNLSDWSRIGAFH